jgi:hypothetical protein
MEANFSQCIVFGKSSGGGRKSCVFGEERVLSVL